MGSLSAEYFTAATKQPVPESRRREKKTKKREADNYDEYIKDGREDTNWRERERERGRKKEEVKMFTRDNNFSLRW